MIKRSTKINESTGSADDKIESDDDKRVVILAKDFRLPEVFEHIQAGRIVVVSASHDEKQQLHPPA